MVSQVLELVFKVVLSGDSIIESLNFLLVGMNMSRLGLFVLGFGSKVTFVILLVLLNRLFGFKL
jgi:hypothetical protein